MKFKTAESVTVGHPDKLCDYIADSILDEALKQDKNARVAVEVMLAHDTLFIGGELTADAELNCTEIAHRAITEVGYSVPRYTHKDIDYQSGDIAQAVDKEDGSLGAGDQGIVYGYCSKAEFSSVRIMDDGEQYHDYPELDKLLQYSPNPLMPAAVFWERTAYYYFKYNNAFIYKELNPLGKIIALWSVDPSRVEFDKISTGEILLKFTVQNKTIIIPYSEIIHIQREVTSDPMFGRKNDESIARVVNLINLNYKGIERAIMTSQFIRFLGKVLTKMNRAELKKKAKEFTADYLNVMGDQDAH